MSIPVNFNNKQIVEPGVYARIASGEPVRPTEFPFGGVVIIDTGNFSGYGGGSGIAGEQKQGKNSIYTFEDVNDFKNFVKGGELYLFSNYLFNPAEGSSGPSQVSIVRACQTTSSILSKTFTNGSIEIKTKNEGKISNGVLNEKKSSLSITLDPLTLVISDVLTFEILNGVIVDETITYVVDSTSQLVNNSKIVDLINSSVSGYSAKMVGNQIVVFAKEGLGVNGDNCSLNNTGDVQFLTSQTPSFTGGVDGTELLKGYAMKVRSGDFDTNKFIVDFYLGSFRGKTLSGFNYGDTDETNSKPILLCSTEEISTVDELIFFAQNDFNFSKSFLIVSENSTTTGSGEILEADISTGFEVAIGGTEIYNPTDLDNSLEFLREFQNTFFICDKFGKEAKSVQNAKILYSVQNNSEFERFLIIGAGKDNTEFEGSPTSSIEVAKYYDTVKAIIVHSGATLFDQLTNKEEKFSSLLTAFNVAGRLGGLEPQEPLTFKNLRLKTYNHILSVSERIRALKSGVLHVREVSNMGIVVNQGINSLQKNTRLFNPDGSSYEISIMSIASQLNKELILNLRPLFVGGSRGRVTEADVKASIEGYLMSQTTLDTDDKLIIKFKNVTVRRIEDRYECNYSFEPNGPINKLLITGFMLDSNI